MGLGHRGREMFKLSALFDGVHAVAACDLKAANWFETQWLSDKPMAAIVPDV